MSVSQVADEVLYTGLIEMQELWGGGGHSEAPRYVAIVKSFYNIDIVILIFCSFTLLINWFIKQVKNFKDPLPTWLRVLLEINCNDKVHQLFPLL